MLTLRLGILGVLLGAAVTTAAEQPRTPAPAIEAERRAVEDLTSRFLTSFERLEMPTFIACFADDATVFFPSPEPPERFKGKAAIRSHFQKVFDGIRRDAPSRPPYHRLDPQDLEVQLLGANAAVVSFHLRNSERLARRTLVLEKISGKWLIAHLHASNIPRALEPNASH
jgi:ketosteroid isomerase-like protein